MKSIKRYSVIFFAIVLLFSLVPFQAFAVDPVSASVISNAFAQAIASYGAANGVSMTFDVSSTDGIGETVHELWKDFREGTQTADDYATIAQAIFPELYYKTATAIGTASDVYAVGVHISDTYAETLDEFYNWLLSGPAEMVQVDNQYYQFSSAQIGSSALPVNVLSIGNYSPVSHDSTNKTVVGFYDSTRYFTIYQTSLLDYSSYCFVTTINNAPAFYYLSDHANVQGSLQWPGDYSNVKCTLTNASYPGVYFNYRDSSVLSNLSGIQVPVFATPADGLSAFSSYFADPSTASDFVGVQAYDTSGIADFPDTADPNYDALNRAKDIPLNIPWDDAIYGDGTGTLTDAQSAAIAGDLTQALETDRTVELVEEQHIPVQPDYSDVLLPLIPINIPSFNFSLSGIWHYVRSWVTSLGAWLSMMFSVWGILPYAIVVPVYACLVIVIVLGLYKRFFM